MYKYEGLHIYLCVSICQEINHLKTECVRMLRKQLSPETKTEIERTG